MERPSYKKQTTEQQETAKRLAAEKRERRRLRNLRNVRP